MCFILTYSFCTWIGCKFHWCLVAQKCSFSYISKSARAGSLQDETQQAGRSSPGLHSFTAAMQHELCWSLAGVRWWGDCFPERSSSSDIPSVPTLSGRLTASLDHAKNISAQETPRALLSAKANGSHCPALVLVVYHLTLGCFLQAGGHLEKRSVHLDDRPRKVSVVKELQVCISGMAASRLSPQLVRLLWFNSDFFTSLEQRSQELVLLEGRF